MRRFQLTAFLFLCAVVVWCFLAGAFVHKASLGARSFNTQIYSEIIRFDPTFAFPGIDIKKTEAGVAAFKISAEVATPPFKGKNLSQDFLFPFDFLEAIPKTEAARRVLLENPTEETAFAYHRELLSLMYAYTEDLERARLLLLPSKNSDTYIYPDGTTSTNLIYDRLVEAEARTAAAIQKENDRFGCALEHQSLCESAISLRLHFGETKVGLEQPQPSEEIWSTVKVLISANLLSSTSTVVALGKSSCYENTPTYYAISTAHSRLSGISASSLQYLNDIYLYDLDKSDQPFFNKLKRAGAHYSYQPFNSYICPDAGVDVGESLTMAYLHESLLTHPFIISNGVVPLALLRLQKAQEAYRKEAVLTSQTYTTFIAAASISIRALSREDLAQYLGGSKEVSRLIETVTLARAKTANFEDTLGYFDNLQVGTFLPNEFAPLKPVGLFLSRGGVSQLFQFANKTAPTEGLSSLWLSRTLITNPYSHDHIALRSYADDVRAELSYDALAVEIEKEALAQQKAFGKMKETLISAREAYEKALAGCKGKVALSSTDAKAGRVWDIYCQK